MRKKKVKSVQNDSVTQQLDNMSNIIADLMNNQDKNKVLGSVEDFKFEQNELDFFYSADPITRKICNKPIYDMLRQGIDIIDDNSDKYIELWEQYNIDEVLEKFGQYNNAFGGSAIIYDVDGLENAQLPLNINQVKQIDNIFVVDRFFLQPNNYKSLIKTQSYKLNQTAFNIHESRMSIAFGIDTGIRNRDNNNGWGKSRTELLFQAISNYHLAHNTLPTILSNFYQTIFKLKGFAATLGTENEKNITKQLHYIQKMRSYLNALVIDSEDDFGTKSINLSNIDKLLEYIEGNLCTVADMPHTKLLEESPGSGLTNSKNNSQSEQYNDYLVSNRKTLYTAPINKILAIFQKVLKLGNKPVKWEFRPLQILNELEIVELRNKQANTDKIYNDIAKESEKSSMTEPIINSRFGSGYYSYETNLKKPSKK